MSEQNDECGSLDSDQLADEGNPSVLNSVTLHRMASHLMSDADVANLAGIELLEWALFNAASVAEEFALARIPASRPRTRGIVAVSAVAFAFRAKTLPRAQELAAQYLADATLPEGTHRTIRTLHDLIVADRYSLHR